MKGPTGFYDYHGYPIHYGDLIKVWHFRHYRRRRNCFLYFVVVAVDGVPCIRQYYQTDGYQCTMAGMGQEAEIIQDNGSESPDQWFDRPKRKQGDA